MLVSSFQFKLYDHLPLDYHRNVSSLISQLKYITTSLRGRQPTSQTHNFEYSSPKFGTGESGIQTNKQTIVNSDIVNENMNSLFIWYINLPPFQRIYDFSQNKSPGRYNYGISGARQINRFLQPC